MSTIGKHAHVVLFYMGLLNKPYLTRMMDQARKENEGFGKFTFEDADTFKGFVDPRFDGAIVDGSVRQDISSRIEAAFSAAGKRVQVLSGTFEDEFKKYEEAAGIKGMTDDPPMSQTDNVTASLNSPQAHVETDGRNDPRPWQGATGTSLDGFGLPLTTTDRKGEGLDLAAQNAAVQQRTAESAADAGSKAANIADVGSGGAEDLAGQAREDRERRQASEAGNRPAGDGEGSGDTGSETGDQGQGQGDQGAEPAKADPAKSEQAKADPAKASGSQTKPASAKPAPAK